MLSWPALGTRVTVRYRRPAGSMPPLTDAVGHLLAVEPVVRVRTKTGAVVECAPADVVALRVLTDAPVRTSEIRALERAAAAAWPGDEQVWLDGWLLRAGQGTGLATNSAMPLDISAQPSAVPAIVEWYQRRGLTPRLAIPDRLLPVSPGWVSEHTEQVMVRDVREPDDSRGGHASVSPERHARVSDAPDGTRWVGLTAAGAPDDARRRQCEALLAWGASLGATRAYMCAHDSGATSLAEALGFLLHHRRRYVPIARDGRTLA